MSGAVQAAAGCAASGGHVIRVTVGSDGSSRGWNSNVVPSVAPSPSAVLGSTIKALDEAIVSGNLRLNLSANVGNSGFRELIVQLGAAQGGVIRLLRSGAAYDLDASGHSRWTWSAAFPAWQVADVGTIRTVQIIY